ncbi:caldesmon-like, partial [Armigeres subalbatus]|uniref:caldesmon-like n=1 Tax=Armigeres subalbatus TaxID=124917 RepID=UPI002ED6BE01
IKLLVTSIKSAVKAAEHEQIALKKKAEAAEKVLKDAAEHTAVETQQAPKRRHEKQRNVQDFASVLKERVKDGEWQTVENQREKRKQQKENVEKRKEQKKQEKRRSPRERVKGDALIVEASDKTSYAAILKKVREDTELKDLDRAEKKAEAAEKVLKDAAEHTALETQQAPKSPRTTRTEKRGRDSPGEQEGTKKQRNVQDFASVLKERVKDAKL